MEARLYLFSDQEKAILNKIGFRLDELEALWTVYVKAELIAYDQYQIIKDIYDLTRRFTHWVTLLTRFENRVSSPMTEYDLENLFFFWETFLQLSRKLFVINDKIHDKTTQRAQYLLRDLHQDEEELSNEYMYEDLVEQFSPFLKSLSVGLYSILMNLPRLRQDHEEEFTRLEQMPAGFFLEEELSMLRKGIPLPLYDSFLKIKWPLMKEFTHDCMKCLKQI